MAGKTEEILGLAAADRAIELAKTAQASVVDVLTELHELRAKLLEPPRKEVE